MNLDKLLESLRKASLKVDFSRTEIKTALEEILSWLNENNTDENCIKVDLFISTQIENEDKKRLPEDIHHILFDMGGALHDTHTSPSVAKNFESTPEQLLERVRNLPS